MNPISEAPALLPAIHMKQELDKVYDEQNQSLSETSVGDPVNAKCNPAKEKVREPAAGTYPWSYHQKRHQWRPKKYVVLWYWSTPSENTLKPLEYIPQHFINYSWRKVIKGTSMPHKAPKYELKQMISSFANKGFLPLAQCEAWPSPELETPGHMLSGHSEVGALIFQMLCLNAITIGDISLPIFNWFISLLCFTWSSTVWMFFADCIS